MLYLITAIVFLLVGAYLESRFSVKVESEVTAAKSWVDQELTALHTRINQLHTKVDLVKAAQTPPAP